MNTEPEFENNLDISEMDTKEKLDLLKGQISGRDPKTGRFCEGHSGNPKGRPRMRTNAADCLSVVLSQKTTMIIDGKHVPMTLLQAYYYKLVKIVVDSNDPKILMQAHRTFGINIDISKELPPPKIKPLKEDPSFEMIKKALFDQIDEECGNNYNPDKMM